MANELVYCPRLFHLEHVQGIFVDSHDTVEGRAQHERAEKRGTKRKAKPKGASASDADSAATPSSTEVASASLPSPGFSRVAPEDVPLRKTLLSDTWGVTGKVDWVEIEGDRVLAVEAKHGSAPKYTDHRWEHHPLPYEAWPADVAQLALYIALLRDHGLDCSEGEILYRESRTRTRIVWSPELEAFARDVVGRAREVAANPKAPDPLEDSPKCPRCSLYEVCLPDEHHALVRISRLEREAANGPSSVTPAEPSDGAAPSTTDDPDASADTTPEVRRIVAGRDDRAVVHVLSAGTVVRKDGEALKIIPRDAPETRVLLKDVGTLALFGAVQVSEQCVQHLLTTGIPIAHHTFAGELIGMTLPLTTRNVGIRRAQYRAADDPARCLEAARAYVLAKIRNQRTILKRYRRGLLAAREEADAGPLPDWAGGVPQEVKEDSAVSARAVAVELRSMKIALSAAERATSIDTLRGHEGDAAARYFEGLKHILPPDWRGDLQGRSRRPPRDRVNAMLSFAYALLTREATAAIARVGLDPMLGLYHSMIPGRPALALDLMEPFRAAWADAALLRLLATSGIERTDFVVGDPSVYLSDAGRRSVIRAFERRADELVTHPRFGYRMSYRRMLELEARILAKWLSGEIDQLAPLWTR
jgi:CRISPR-associated protein Cas1